MTIYKFFNIFNIRSFVKIEIIKEYLSFQFDLRKIFGFTFYIGKDDWFMFRIGNSKAIL